MEFNYFLALIMDKGKYCRFHRSHGHVTEDCVHLKDAVEILIHQGHLRRYRKGGEKPRESNDVQRAAEAQMSEDEDQGNMPVAFAITRPEDFILPAKPDGEEILNHLASHMDGT
jgi:hypothetical protein